MEEKNLVTLPYYMVEYLEFAKKFLSIKGALNLYKESFKGDKDKVNNFLSDSSNQEKFVNAWVNGYKVEEKKFLVKFKNLGDVYGYLNYEREAKNFKLSSKDESKYFQTIFTKKFLEENGFGWVFDSEGVNVIEVEND